MPGTVDLLLRLTWARLPWTMLGSMRRCAAPAALALLGALTAGCPGDPAGPGDGGVDAPQPPDGPTGDGRPMVLAVDFTVMGCPDFDPAIPQCRGPAPLTLTFVPITSGAVTRFLWDFGDLSKSFEALPTHTYSLPESYDVSLLGAPALTMQTRKAFVVVKPNPLGGTCDLERQCNTGLTCLCGLASQCPSAFARGVCTRDCESSSDCPEDAFCADMGLGSDDTDPTSWRRQHCLRRCNDDGNCAPGQTCRQLPAAGTPERWERACFYRFPGELGAACRGGTGEPQKDLCLSGLCAELGALGVCSFDCAGRTCPAGTTCASFRDGRKLCLRPCETPDACRGDPLLVCTPPGRPGPLGWDAAGAPAGTTLCAPKPCDSDAPCAPAGICLGGAGASHCTRRTGTGSP
jgi:hypothetical protein